MKCRAMLLPSVLMPLVLFLTSCAAIQREMRIDATGAAHATTLETAPVALFSGDATVTSRIIADWCSGSTVLASDSTMAGVREALGDLASDASVEWSLDAQSGDEIECSATHDLSTRYSRPNVPDVGVLGDLTEGIQYDFIFEWVTFTLTATTQGGTCVVGSPEVRRNDSDRQMGSYTNLEEVLAELGGSIAPAAKTTCQPSRL